MSPSDLFFWKDVVYYREGSTPKLLIFDRSNNETNFAAAMGTKDDSRFDESAEMPRSNYRQRALFGSSFFGDENFLVHVCDRGFPAWCSTKVLKWRRETRITRSIVKTGCRSAWRSSGFKTQKRSHTYKTTRDRRRGHRKRWERPRIP